MKDWHCAARSCSEEKGRKGTERSREGSDKEEGKEEKGKPARQNKERAKNEEIEKTHKVRK